MRRPRTSSSSPSSSLPSSSSPSSLKSPLRNVNFACYVLRHVRIEGVRDVIKCAQINDAFRDALESWSPTFWRRLAAHLESLPDLDDASSPESRTLSAFFKRDVFAWVADNLLTVGQLDVSRMEEHPLLIAAKNGAADVVRVCLAAVPDCVNDSDRDGVTALFAASGGGHGECAHELLDAGADIMIVDNVGETVLHYAAEQGNDDVVRLLVAHSEFEEICDVRNNKGKTALHVAVSHDRTECAHELLDAGADIMIVDNVGDTVLHYAAEQGNDDIVRLLVAHSEFEEICDVRNNKGKTAMDLTRREFMKQLLARKQS